MMIALTYEESEKVPKLVQDLISVEDKLIQCKKNCSFYSTTNECDCCDEYEDYRTKIGAINADPLMQQPIIHEYVYAMLRQHKYKKEIDELQNKINETYNIEKNYQKSIVVGDFYNDEE